jgi:hypothetical protein
MQVLGGILRPTRAAHTAAKTVVVIATSGVSKPILYSQTRAAETPNWGFIADELSTHLNNNKVSAILKAIPQHEDRLAALSPKNCNKEDTKAISKICSMFGYVENGGSDRDAGKAWYQRALEFDENNTEAQEGLRGIRSEEGDPDVKVDHIDSPHTSNTHKR